MLVEKTSQMAPATAKAVRKLRYGEIQDFIDRKLLEDLGQMLFLGNKATSLRVGVFEFERENRGGDTQNVGPMVEVELRRDLGQQPMALSSGVSGSGVEFGDTERIGDALQQAKLRAGE